MLTSKHARIRATAAGTRNRPLPGRGRSSRSSSARTGQLSISDRTARVVTDGPGIWPRVSPGSLAPPSSVPNPIVTPQTRPRLRTAGATMQRSRRSSPAVASLRPRVRPDRPDQATDVRETRSLTAFYRRYMVDPIVSELSPPQADGVNQRRFHHDKKLAGSTRARRTRPLDDRRSGIAGAVCVGSARAGRAESSVCVGAWRTCSAPTCARHGPGRAGAQGQPGYVARDEADHVQLPVAGLRRRPAPAPTSRT